MTKQELHMMTTVNAHLFETQYCHLVNYNNYNLLAGHMRAGVLGKLPL